MKERVLGNACGIAIICAWMVLWLFAGCANITTPPGGKKDTIPPRLLSVVPANKSINIRPKKIELKFDEYITVNDVSKEVQISPILAIDPVVLGLYKKVTVKIQDTLLEDNTTYRISFGKCIRDLHEGNVFKNYTYTFSTGAYFDSLSLSGNVITANTGLPDTSAIVVALYSATDIDSAVVRHKPKYVTITDNKGNFTFKGLPSKKYRIYAIKDANVNRIYDGPPEMIAFNDSVVNTGDSIQKPITLRLFTEPADTSIKKVDTVSKKPGVVKNQSVESIKYTLNVDTTSPKKRTFDINYNVKLTFNQPFILNQNKIALSYDSEGTNIITTDTIITDTAHPLMVTIASAWRPNTLYTIRLPKGFAKDTTGAEAQPGRYSFRTWKDEDYGKINIHLPSKYKDSVFVLQVTCETDTIYQKPVSDTIINFRRLKPSKYAFRVIVDKNHNGKWDSGNLFGKLQPEEVIPYPDIMNLKADWENIVDFEVKKPVPKPKK